MLLLLLLLLLKIAKEFTSIHLSDTYSNVFWDYKLRSFGFSLAPENQAVYLWRNDRKALVKLKNIVSGTFLDANISRFRVATQETLLQMQILRPRQESKCRALLPFPFPSSLFPISGIRFETPVKHMSAPRGERFLCMPTFRSNIAARLPASKLSCLGSPHQRIIYERGRSHENQPRRAKSSSEKNGAGTGATTWANHNKW